MSSKKRKQISAKDSKDLKDPPLGETIEKLNENPQSFKTFSTKKRKTKEDSDETETLTGGGATDTEKVSDPEKIDPPQTDEKQIISVVEQVDSIENEDLVMEKDNGNENVDEEEEGDEAEYQSEPEDMVETDDSDPDESMHDPVFPNTVLAWRKKFGMEIYPKTPEEKAIYIQQLREAPLLSKEKSIQWWNIFFERIHSKKDLSLYHTNCQILNLAFNLDYSHDDSLQSTLWSLQPFEGQFFKPDINVCLPMDSSNSKEKWRERYRNILISSCLLECLDSEWKIQFLKIYQDSIYLHRSIHPDFENNYSVKIIPNTPAYHVFQTIRNLSILDKTRESKQKWLMELLVRKSMGCVLAMDFKREIVNYVPILSDFVMTQVPPSSLIPFSYNNTSKKSVPFRFHQFDFLCMDRSESMVDLVFD